MRAAALALGARMRSAAASDVHGLPVTYERLLNATAEPGNWLTYSGDYRSHHYSSLNQITADNVQRLRAKWIYQMHRQKVETTPIVVDGVMYVTRPPSDVIALDAETGRALWTFEHKLPGRVYVCCGEVNRGLAILGNTLFLTTLDAQLIALDARAGRVLWRKAIADPALNYTATGAPLAVKDKVIVGIAGAEGGIRGFLDAYDANTGERRWRFWTVPAPGEPGSDTWGGDSWRNGGASTWLTGSYDPELNLLYWGTGNPGPDYNGDVRPGDNSLLVLAPGVGSRHGQAEMALPVHAARHARLGRHADPVLIDSSTGRKARRRSKPERLLLRPGPRTGEFLLAKPFVKQTWAQGDRREGAAGGEPRPGADARGQRVDLARRRRRDQLDVAQLQPDHTAALLQRARRAAAFFKTDAPEFRPGEAFFGGGGGGGARFA